MTKQERKELNRAVAALAGAIRSGDAAEVDRWQHTVIVLEGAEEGRRRHVQATRR